MSTRASTQVTSRCLSRNRRSRASDSAASRSAPWSPSRRPCNRHDPSSSWSNDRYSRRPGDASGAGGSGGLKLGRDETPDLAVCDSSVATGLDAAFERHDRDTFVVFGAAESRHRRRCRYRLLPEPDRDDGQTHGNVRRPNLGRYATIPTASPPTSDQSPGSDPAVTGVSLASGGPMRTDCTIDSISSRSACGRSG